MKYEDIMIEDYGKYFEEAMDLSSDIAHLSHRSARLHKLRAKILGTRFQFIRKLCNAEKIYTIDNRLAKTEVAGIMNVLRMKELTEKSLEIKKDLLKYNKKQIEEKLHECGIDPKEGLGAFLALKGKFDNYDDRDGNQA